MKSLALDSTVAPAGHAREVISALTFRECHQHLNSFQPPDCSHMTEKKITTHMNVIGHQIQVMCSLPHTQVVAAPIIKTNTIKNRRNDPFLPITRLINRFIWITILRKKLTRAEGKPSEGKATFPASRLNVRHQPDDPVV